MIFLVKLNYNDWIGLDFTEISKHHKELEEFDDYIPLVFHNHVSSSVRLEYLRENNLFDEIEKATYNARMDFHESKDKVDWIVRDVIDWVNKYPEYMCFVKTKG